MVKSINSNDAHCHIIIFYTRDTDLNNNDIEKVNVKNRKTVQQWLDPPFIRIVSH